MREIDITTIDRDSLVDIVVVTFNEELTGDEKIMDYI